jgi:hypothetical protein
LASSRDPHLSHRIELLDRILQSFRICSKSVVIVEKICTFLLVEDTLSGFFKNSKDNIIKTTTTTTAKGMNDDEYQQ